MRAGASIEATYRFLLFDNISEYGERMEINSSGMEGVVEMLIRWWICIDDHL